MNLSSLYISPLESCNLHCRLCYTRKHSARLSNSQILDFIAKYSDFIHKSYFINLKSVLFCGGEVFLLPDFPALVNQLLANHIFVTIITNGTIDYLTKISDPQNCQLLVSLDGPETIHDANRGHGNFAKSLDFIRHSLELGFPTEIMFLVTRSSYPHLDSLPQYLQTTLGQPIKFNYITYKSSAYTTCHPLSQDTPDSESLTPEQIINIKKNYPSIPGPQFGCSQISLQSSGQIYGCCESPTAIGKITDPVSQIIDNLSASFSTCKECRFWSKEQFSEHSEHESTMTKEPKGSTHRKIRPSTKTYCHGCCDPDFLCGYKKELQLTTCQQVVSKFNQN